MIEQFIFLFWSIMEELNNQDTEKFNISNEWGEPTPEEERAWEFLEQKIKNQTKTIHTQDQK